MCVFSDQPIKKPVRAVFGQGYRCSRTGPAAAAAAAVAAVAGGAGAGDARYMLQYLKVRIRLKRSAGASP